MTFPSQLTQAERVAETFGVVLGAASQCGRMTEERLSSIAVKMRDVVWATASDEADAEAANERFFAAVEAGMSAAESGKLDAETAETALSEIEERLSE